MDRFGALSAFVAVVEHGGFAPAARRLGLAPSSLTRQLNALEASLGTRLMNRSTRSVTLTEAGAQYYDDARRILEELDSADRTVSELAGPPSGLLRVTMPVAFGRLHVAPAIPAFLRRFPGMRLDIRLTDAMVNLVEDRIDVAIRLGALTAPNLVARKLAPHRRVICASPDYLGEHGTPAQPRDLAHHNCLLFDYLTGDSTWTLTRDGKREKVPVSGNLRANGSELLREAAMGGAGMLLMPTWLVGDDIAAGRLVPVLEPWTPTPGADEGEGEGAIWAVYLPNRRGSKKLAGFLDFLAQHFGAPPYWERYRS
ncbi:LysR family transcriptional regulator [Ralstonia nicotianae]|uniref:LysR family transcriptional regulator n=3 Tax=Ralstonia solanacearum species complex TaxID=3116862 RepID=UPI000E5858BA|nr:transcriptional regulator [Ralstonia solanacearum]AXW16990.1 transcriptional regulator [Ralstonia solanacearum]AXW40833.1 transcriptional regulator [Ralstonia solanacearum]AXW73629.1 transcriptional regulator [Ralstonia solanacearum]BEU69692.1 LysR family transcriptional regulator [Ralstonia pseudosolanacearum]